MARKNKLNELYPEELILQGKEYVDILKATYGEKVIDAFYRDYCALVKEYGSAHDLGYRAFKELVDAYNKKYGISLKELFICVYTFDVPKSLGDGVKEEVK